MYRKIVVAVDFATEAEKVLLRSRQLAEVHGASLVLVHVTEPAALSAAMVGPDGLGLVTEDAELDEQLMDAARDRLTNMARDAGLNDTELRIELGLPAATLVRVAEETGADLIVVGHHERHGLAVLFGAGTDSGVLHHAPCDLLAIHV